LVSFSFITYCIIAYKGAGVNPVIELKERGTLYEVEVWAQS
jgi:hypothetical protein